jgi:hypothetical protein
LVEQRRRDNDSFLSWYLWDTPERATHVWERPRRTFTLPELSSPYGWLPSCGILPFAP